MNRGHIKQLLYNQSYLSDKQLCNIMYYNGGIVMATISLRMNEEEEKLIQEYAKANNVSISELFRSSVLEKIEDEIDLELYQQAMQEHMKHPGYISFEDMIKELDAKT